jgi:hypothetical protein
MVPLTAPYRRVGILGLSDSASCITKDPTESSRVQEFKSSRERKFKEFQRTRSTRVEDPRMSKQLTKVTTYTTQQRTDRLLTMMKLVDELSQVVLAYCNQTTTILFV